MAATPSTNTAIPDNYRIPLLLILIAAGLAGNYFNVTLFLSINLIFGSIFAMLALQFFGIGRGVFAAAIIAGYTWVLWNHPYAIIIMTAEVAVVGWLIGRTQDGDGAGRYALLVDHRHAAGLFVLPPRHACSSQYYYNCHDQTGCERYRQCPGRPFDLYRLCNPVAIIADFVQRDSL